eukprot:686171-Rhodomonas_salina.1
MAAAVGKLSAEEQEGASTWMSSGYDTEWIFPFDNLRPNTFNPVLDSVDTMPEYVNFTRFLCASVRVFEVWRDLQLLGVLGLSEEAITTLRSLSVALRGARAAGDIHSTVMHGRASCSCVVSVSGAGLRRAPSCFVHSAKGMGMRNGEFRLGLKILTVPDKFVLAQLAISGTPMRGGQTVAAVARRPIVTLIDQQRQVCRCGTPLRDRSKAGCRSTAHQ